MNIIIVAQTKIFLERTTGESERLPNKCSSNAGKNESSVVWRIISSNLWEDALFLSAKARLQQQNIASKWAIAIMSLELFNKAIYLLKHITRKLCISDGNRELSYLITHRKNLPPPQPAETSPPASAEPWQQNPSRFMETERVICKRKKPKENCILLAFVVPAHGNLHAKGWFLVSLQMTDGITVFT